MCFHVFNFMLDELIESIKVIFVAKVVSRIVLNAGCTKHLEQLLLNTVLILNKNSLLQKLLN